MKRGKNRNWKKTEKMSVRRQSGTEQQEERGKGRREERDIKGKIRLQDKGRKHWRGRKRGEKSENKREKVDKRKRIVRVAIERTDD